jgi:glycopeptide antibiotics resistance protein
MSSLHASFFWAIGKNHLWKLLRCVPENDLGKLVKQFNPTDAKSLALNCTAKQVAGV